MENQFQDLNIRALKAFSDLEGTPRGESVSEVRELIEQVRKLLALPERQLGVWETSELNYADHVLDAGFPRLALLAAGTAIAVFQLSAEEYAFGFDMARQHAEELAKNNLSRAGAEKHQKKAATSLVADQHETAAALTLSQEQTAKALEAGEKETASNLALSQEEAAASLKRENQLTAAEMAEIDAEDRERAAAKEALQILRQQALEQVLSWTSGGYSIKDAIPAEVSPAAADGHKETAARKLKGRQDKTAEALKEIQLSAATDLKESEKTGAGTLKNMQLKAAEKLKETQTTKAVQKIISEARTEDSPE